jgi:phosphatidylglycerol lysyltransferase
MARRENRADDLTRIYPLLRRYAWNATAYQIVNPGIQHWFSEAGDAVIGYMTRHRVRVVAGAPVCPEERLADVVAEWNADAARCHERSCYFGAAGRVFGLLSVNPRYSVVALGAQPVWNPQEWPEPARMRSSLRAQLSRARNKGVMVREWTPREAEGHPELRRLLDEWLAGKPLPPMRFLVQPETLETLTDKRLFVAERDGIPIGFLNAAPIPTRAGWLTEQFVRGRSAPNGTVELMLDTMMRTVARDGAQYVTMGLAPLSEAGWNPKEINPIWLRWAAAWARAHGRRFYNFGGLEAFKAKMNPREWEPIYAIAQEPRFTMATLYAVGEAFSDPSPFAMLGRGLAKAVRQEIRWLLK